MDNIHMVDLQAQYLEHKQEIDQAIQEVITESAFIGGKYVKRFTDHLAEYLGSKHVIGVGNGTDALQIALMALELKPGDEVIVPAFTYAATAEVIALLGLIPVMVDVDEASFNVTAEQIEKSITKRTKAIMPVSLFGQSVDILSIMELARKHNLIVIEDNAQSIGSDIRLSENRIVKAGTPAHIACTSFYPSKNLGAYGDGGAIYTDDVVYAKRIMKIANHGQSQKYYHEIIGCNSRLDAIQAVILDVKLSYLDNFNSARYKAAQAYREQLKDIDQIVLPTEVNYGNHIYHQFTIRILDGRRDALKKFLNENQIPTMVYYPLPLYKQKAFEQYEQTFDQLKNTELLCTQVLSLPMHPYLREEQIEYITLKIKEYFA